jgi:hypothetical protein
MVAVLQDKLNDVARLCREYDVATLELFGSAADGTFDPNRSDLDFLVEFSRSPETNTFHQFFGFKHALEDLFARQVDLVSAGAMRNPYFIQAVNKSRMLIYAA